MSKKILLGAICTVLFCGTSATVFAQDNAPSGAASSLLNSADPRAAGMGMATTAVNDNPFGIFGNAASNLLSEKRMGFGYSYNPVMPDYNKGVATHAVGGYFNLDENNGFSLGFRYFNGPKSIIAGDDAVAGDSFRPNDMAVSIGYTRRIVDNFTMSLTARYIRSDYTKFGSDYYKAGNAFTFDLGFYYENTIESFYGSTWAAGLNVSNVGTKLDISVPSNPIAMPAYAKLGGSIDMPFSENHKLLAALDLGYTFMPSTDASFTAGLGLEYNFLKHGFLRAGYHYGDEKSIGGSYATVGLGAAVGPVRVDASYWIAGKESPVKNTWAVGLSLFF